jgi:hypothetical protein
MAGVPIGATGVAVAPFSCQVHGMVGMPIPDTIGTFDSNPQL